MAWRRIAHSPLGTWGAEDNDMTGSARTASSRWLALACALGSAAMTAANGGCLADVPTSAPPGGSPDPSPGPGPAPVPASVQGLVTSPINGQLYTGVTTQTTVTVSGTYTGSSNNVTIQISDP